MGVTDFASLPAWGNGLVFLLAAAVIWWTGTRLSGTVEQISERTGIGTAFLGAVMLGGITSLPEVATSVTASLGGNADMAVNNLLGGVAMQVAVLAVVDVVHRSGPLSRSALQPVVLLEGSLLVAVLALVVGATVVGEPAGWPVGPWAAAVFASALISFFLVRRYEDRPAWRPVTEEGLIEEALGPPEEEEEEGDADTDRSSTKALLLRAGGAALGILVAGFLVTRTGEALAEQTGLGSSFVGVALVAVSTSLPELSTTLAAVRLGRFDMAFSNVLGANLLDLSLLALVDVTYAGRPVLGEMGPFAQLAAVLGIVLTAVYLAGLTRRRVRSFAGVGVDSMAVLALYAAGLFALYRMR